MDLLYQSMQDSAGEARFLLGRPSSRATREEALQQVAMLKAAKEAAQPIGRSKKPKNGYRGMGES